MRAEIISVGTELLLGTTINSDAADVALLLSEYGINVYWQTVVGDNPGRAIEAVRRARDRADIIITTGGLGPTCDDLTKNAIAEAFGLRLVLNEGEKEWLLSVWNERHYTSFTENNFQQVMLPEGSEPLRNDWGTAPGCVLRADGVLVIMLPGPPREIRPMLEHRVRPILASLSDGVIASHTIHFFGRLHEFFDESHPRALRQGGGVPRPSDGESVRPRQSRGDDEAGHRPCARALRRSGLWDGRGLPRGVYDEAAH